MTVQTLSKVKNNWVSFSTLIILIGFVMSQSQWHQEVDDHMNNESVHMKFERKIQVFVPRIELDSRLHNIEKNQMESNKNLAKIYELLLEQQ